MRNAISAVLLYLKAQAIQSLRHLDQNPDARHHSMIQTLWVSWVGCPVSSVPFLWGQIQGPVDTKYAICHFKLVTSHSSDESFKALVSHTVKPQVLVRALEKQLLFKGKFGYG